MELNLTSIYVSLLIPITLSYIHMNKEKLGNKALVSLLFLFFLMAVISMRGNYRWDRLIFNIRRLIG